MKILNIVSHSLFPVSDGGRAHSFSSILALSKANEVVILSPDKSIPEAYKNNAISLTSYALPNSKLKFLSFVFLYQLKKLSGKVDKVIVDYPWFALHCLILRVPYEIREHNVEFLRFKSYGSWFWPLLYWYERLVYKYAEKIHCISSGDKELLLKHFNLAMDRCIVSPYSPDGSRFFSTSEHTEKIRKELNINENELFILFFGKLDYKPNLEGIDLILNEIIPRLNDKQDFEYKIVICGKNAPNISNDNVILVGYVDDIAAYIQSCDVMINPIVSGGGVKTKVLETLACKRKVISTKQGAIGVEPDANLVVVGDWDSMVDELLKVNI